MNELLRRKKFVYLCTNGIKLDKWLPQWKPSPYLTINVSMDGLEPTHDVIRSRRGLYQIDIRMIIGGGDGQREGFRGGGTRRTTQDSKFEIRLHSSERDRVPSSLSVQCKQSVFDIIRYVS